MDRDRFLLYLAGVFAGLTMLLVVAALARQPFLLVLALPFGATTYFLWYHATGRLAARTRRRVRAEARWRESAATGGAGPKADWVPPGGRTRGRRGRTSGTREPQSSSTRLSRAEAYRTLDLEPGASRAAVRRAYRRKVKEVHPDTDSGDEESFKRVTRAYDTLTE